MENMIDLQKLAQSISDGLNALSEDFNFVIGINAKDYSPTVPPKRGNPVRVVNGLMISQQAVITPAKNLNNYFLPITFGFDVREQDLDKVQSVLMQYIRNIVGTIIEIDGWFAIVNYDLPTVGAIDVEGGVGSYAPIVTTAYYNVFQGNVASNNCKLLINGEEMVYYKMDVARSRFGEEDNEQNSEETYLWVQRQKISFALSIPYRDTPVCKEIVKDAFSGTVDKKYTVTYSDPQIGDFTYLMAASDIGISYVAGQLAQIGLKLSNGAPDNG